MLGDMSESRRRRILVVDDDPDTLLVIGETLSARGFELLEARDGQVALAVAEAAPGPIDLLVTDLVMPYVGGFGLAKRLRETRPDLRVLYVTGYGPGSSARAGEPNGDFLQKPFTLEELCERVDRALLRGVAA